MNMLDLFDGATLRRQSFSYRDIIGQTPSPQEWTPTLTFATPGNLVAGYSLRVARHMRIGRLAIAGFQIRVTTFTHSSASGALRITGLPYTSYELTGLELPGGCTWQGITKANYTDAAPYVPSNVSYVQFGISGSGQNVAVVAASDMPTGGTVNLAGLVAYFTEA